MQEPPEEIDDLASIVVDAALDVHRELGPGYLESVYEDALAVELDCRDVPFTTQDSVPVDYRGHRVGHGRVDMMIDDSLVVEIKAVEEVAPIHRARVISYLKAMQLPLALLLNFKAPLMKEGTHRIIRSSAAAA